MSIASPLMPPSPNGRRVGIRLVTFEACSAFTHLTARRIAQQPKAAFVAGLRPDQLPSRAACQLPDLSTIIRMRSSLTDGSRPRGALPFSDLSTRSTLDVDLLDHIMGAGEQRRRHCNAERLRGEQIDHQLK